MKSMSFRKVTGGKHICPPKNYYVCVAVLLFFYSCFLNLLFMYNMPNSILL